jgi:GNAT superfamily N-acetyltransferase
MQILSLSKSHIDGLVQLESEFEDYIQSLSSVERDNFDREAKKQQLLKYAFWKDKIFSGYVAKIWKNIVWYVLYHYGFDPDEMQGKIIYMTNLFVTEKVRWKWVGKALIAKLQSHPDSIGIYFWVWKKNIPTIWFYQKLGADWIEDVPFMKLMK